jgi:hypothetical protein
MWWVIRVSGVCNRCSVRAAGGRIQNEISQVCRLRSKAGQPQVGGAIVREDFQGLTRKHNFTDAGTYRSRSLQSLRATALCVRLLHFGIGSVSFWSLHPYFLSGPTHVTDILVCCRPHSCAPFPFLASLQLMGWRSADENYL